MNQSPQTLAALAILQEAIDRTHRPPPRYHFVKPAGHDELQEAMDRTTAALLARKQEQASKREPRC